MAALLVSQWPAQRTACSISMRTGQQHAHCVCDVRALQRRQRLRTGGVSTSVAGAAETSPAGQLRQPELTTRASVSGMRRRANPLTEVDFPACCPQRAGLALQLAEELATGTPGESLPLCSSWILARRARQQSEELARGVVRPAPALFDGVKRSV